MPRLCHQIKVHRKAISELIIPLLLVLVAIFSSITVSIGTASAQSNSPQQSLTNRTNATEGAGAANNMAEALVANITEAVVTNVINAADNTTIPLADAGDDRIVNESQVVQLDGSASTDPDGDTLTYAWTQTAGTNVTLSGANSATPAFTAPDASANGHNLTFELTVSDGNGNTATDTVNVIVIANGASINQPLNQTALINFIFQSWLPHIFIAVVFLVIAIPLVIDIILAYRYKPTDGSTDKDRVRVRGMPGLNRSLMTFGIIILLGTVIFYLLALISLNMNNPSNPAFVSLVDLLRNLGIILGTALATIIAFYFGIRGSESSVEKASNAIVSGIKSTEAADVEGPPKVLSTKPADGAENVPTNTPISATFSEPMSSGTIDSNTFSVRKDGGSLINGKISLSPDPKTAEFNPDQDLEPGTRYIAEISERVKDLAGNAVGSITRWTFTTAADTTPPTVGISSPAGGGTVSGPSSGVTVPVTGTASDESGGSGIQKVEVKVGSNPFKLPTATGPGGSADWSTWSASDVVTTAGSTTILARATDNAGNTKDATITVTVAFSGGGGTGTTGGTGDTDKQGLGSFQSIKFQSDKQGLGSFKLDINEVGSEITQPLGFNDLPAPPSDKDDDWDKEKDAFVKNEKGDPVVKEWEIAAKNKEELRDAIIYANQHWTGKGGHIIIEGSFNVDELQGIEEFENLQTGSDRHPIIIRAKTNGAATITGKGKLDFKNTKNLWLYGINFDYMTEMDGDKESNMSFIKAEQCRIARCDFHTGAYTKHDFKNGEYKKDPSSEYYNYYLFMKGGKNNTIDHNTFHDKQESLGTFVAIGAEPDTHIVCRNTVIEHNYFFNHPGRKMGENGGEALRIGLAELKTACFNSKVKNNLFEKCNGDPECISNKGLGNLYSGNTFRNNMGGLSFRHGHDNIADGNYFEGGHRGILILGAKETVSNNYFKDVAKLSNEYKHEDKVSDDGIAPIVVRNGDPVSNPDDPPSYEQVKGAVIENNIIIKTDEGASKIVMWGKDKDKPMKPVGCSFNNNITVLKEGTVFKFSEGARLRGENFKDMDENKFSNNIVLTGDKKSIVLYEKEKDGNEEEVALSEKECSIEEIDLKKTLEKGEQGLNQIIQKTIESKMQGINMKIPTPLQPKDVGPSSDPSYRWQDVLQGPDTKGPSTNMI